MILERQSPWTPAFEMIHIEAKVLYVDMVSPKTGMAFQLTQETIQVLVEFYENVSLVEYGASMVDGPGKRFRLQKLQQEFVKAVSNVIFCTSVSALKELDETGAGMLSGNECEEAKAWILALFAPKPPLHGDGVHVTQPVKRESGFSSEAIHYFRGPLETSMARLGSGIGLDQDTLLLLRLSCVESQHSVALSSYDGQYLAHAGSYDALPTPVNDVHTQQLRLPWWDLDPQCM